MANPEPTQTQLLKEIRTLTTEVGNLKREVRALTSEVSDKDVSDSREYCIGGSVTLWLILSVLTAFGFRWLFAPSISFWKTFVGSALILIAIWGLFRLYCWMSQKYRAHPYSTWSHRPRSFSGYFSLFLVLVIILIGAAIFFKANPGQTWWSDIKLFLSENTPFGVITQMWRTGSEDKDPSGRGNTSDNIVQPEGVPSLSLPQRNGAGTCWSMALRKGNWENKFLLENGKPEFRVKVGKPCWQTCPSPKPNDCDPRIECQKGKNPHTSVVQDKCPNYSPMF